MKALYSPNVNGGGKIIDHGIQQRLHPLVSIRRTAQYRNQSVVNGCLAQSTAAFRGGDLLAVKIFFHQCIVILGCRFQDLLAIDSGLFTQIFRYFNLIAARAQIIFINVGAACDQIYNATKIAFAADGQLQRQRPGVQSFLQLPDHAKKIGTNNIHLVHVGDPGNMVTVGLSPNRFRLRFHPALCAENSDHSIEDAHGTFHFDGKVHVSWRVNNVNPAIFPHAGRCRRSDRDPAFLFLGHPIHGGGALMYFT